MKRITALILLLFISVMAIVSCGGEEEDKTVESISESQDETIVDFDENTLYLSSSICGSVSKEACGYEIVVETFEEGEKLLNFAGQDFRLSALDREITRVIGTSGENGVLRCYETYKGTLGAVQMRAGYSKGADRPMYVDISGENVIVLKGKSEAQTKEMLENWLFSIFRFDSSDTVYSVSSYYKGEIVDRFIDGCERYFFYYKQNVGGVELRSASITLTENQVILLVAQDPVENMAVFENIDLSRIEGLLQERLEGVITGAVSLSVSIQGTPVYGRYGDFKFIGLNAIVYYKKNGITKEESFGAIFNIDLL